MPHGRCVLPLPGLPNARMFSRRSRKVPAGQCANLLTDACRQALQVERLKRLVGRQVRLVLKPLDALAAACLALALKKLQQELLVPDLLGLCPGGGLLEALADRGQTQLFQVVTNGGRHVGCLAHVLTSTAALSSSS